MPAARLEQTACPGEFEQPIEQTLFHARATEAVAELAQKRVVEAGIGKVESQKVLPVDPRPHRLGSLPIAQALPELHQGHQRQPPGRVGRLTVGREKVGEVAVCENAAELVAQDQIWRASPEGSVGYAGGIQGHGRDQGLRMQRHGGDLLRRSTPTVGRARFHFANSIRSFSIRADDMGLPHSDAIGLVKKAHALARWDAALDRRDGRLSYSTREAD